MSRINISAACDFFHMPPIERVDFIDTLSQKCKHFCEGDAARRAHSLRLHTCGLRSVFSEVRAPVKNGI